MGTLGLTACMYTPPVNQGKAFSKNQVHALKLHMTKAQVKKVLGEPVIQHHGSNHWTYVDYHFSQRQQTRQQLLLSFNKNNQLTKVETKKLVR